MDMRVKIIRAIAGGGHSGLRHKEAREIIERLDAAGFAIVPREPPRDLLAHPFKTAEQAADFDRHLARK